MNNFHTYNRLSFAPVLLPERLKNDWKINRSFAPSASISKMDLSKGSSSNSPCHRTWKILHRRCGVNSPLSSYLHPNSLSIRYWKVCEF